MASARRSWRAPPLDRERVLDLWAEGLTARAIAVRLDEPNAGRVRDAIAAARGKGDARAVEHPRGTPATWPEALVARLTALWAEGRSASEVARALGGGVTRSAVIGKVHRLALPPRSEAVRRGRSRSPAPTAGARRQRTADRGAPSPAGKVARPPGRARTEAARAAIAALVAMPAPHAAPVRLVARRDDQCAFIAGDPAGADTLMCGAPVAAGFEGTAYCAFHRALAYVPLDDQDAA